MSKNNPKLFVLSALLCFVFQNRAFAQSDNDIYFPQCLWVQVDRAKAIFIPHDEQNVSVEAFREAFRGAIPSDLHITEILKPFYFASAAEVSEVYEVYFNSDVPELDVAAQLERIAGINYAERIPIMRPAVEPNDLGPPSGTDNQYALWTINAPAAWEITTGSAEVKVAIVDDAILVTHPDLAPNMTDGYNAFFNNDDPMPTTAGQTHGTHVAGIAGAATDNGLGVASIGYNIKIMPIKTTGFSGALSGALQGVIWAAENGADVINMSFGGPQITQSWQNVVNYAYNKGCVLVGGGGNNNSSNTFYPAAYDKVIGVASTGPGDIKSDFSNFGDYIDVAAPGTDILSTGVSQFQPIYEVRSGTSMATPLVSGLAALLLSIHPEMTPEQVADCIISTADNIDALNPGFEGQLGSGRINALAAVQCAQAIVNSPPVAQVQTPSTVNCPGTVVSFYGSSAGGIATSYQWTFPGGNPSSSTDQNPQVVYSQPGIYDVLLDASNDFGNDEIILEGYIEVSSNGIDEFFFVDFEAESLESLGWTVSSPDGWNIFPVGGLAQGSKAAGIHLFNSPDVGSREFMDSPPISLEGYSNVQLDFQHAYQQRILSRRDSLTVYVSTDGGSTFPHRVLSIAESQNGGTFATSFLLNNNFVPSLTTDWCFLVVPIGPGCFSIDLSEFDGEPDVRLRFESYNDGGNNIYVNNVQLSGNCMNIEAAPLANFSASATAICTGETVQFVDQSMYVPTSYAWTFEGGTPASSTLAMPVVTYDAPGVYDVTLMVTNEFGTGELVQEGYMVVSATPSLFVTASDTVVCAGQSLSLEATGADAFTWEPPIGLSSTSGANVTATPPTSITYTATGFSAGCSGSQSISIEVLPSLPIPVIEWNGDNLLFVGNTTAEVYQWYLNGIALVGATGLELEVTESGSYTVEATDNNGCTTTSQPYELLVTSTGQIEGGSSELRIFPVPSRDHVQVELPKSLNGYMVRIFTADGRSVVLPQAQAQGGTHLTIDLSGWAPGTYFVQALSETLLLNGRIVKVE